MDTGRSGVGLPRRLDELGIHDTFVVALYGTVLTSGAASLVGLTNAKLTAHLGYAALMRIAAGAWTAALLVFTVAGHWAVLLIVPVLTGIGSGITMPTLTVLDDRAAPPNSAAPPPRCRRPRSAAASSPRLCSSGR
ncbi:hypothetical protein ACFT7U_35490 [Streptomyces rochei]|uniref:hypothetical protein n=1 Tax=Streptomyces rochei TaxID=1928 RepID=UPI003626ABC3